MATPKKKPTKKPKANIGGAGIKWPAKKPDPRKKSGK